jgi:hypothetical protein
MPPGSGGTAAAGSTRSDSFRPAVRPLMSPAFAGEWLGHWRALPCTSIPGFLTTVRDLLQADRCPSVRGGGKPSPTPRRSGAWPGSPPVRVRLRVCLLPASGATHACGEVRVGLGTTDLLRQPTRSKLGDGGRMADSRQSAAAECGSRVRQQSAAAESGSRVRQQSAAAECGSRVRQQSPAERSGTGGRCPPVWAGCGRDGEERYADRCSSGAVGSRTVRRALPPGGRVPVSGGGKHDGEQRCASQQVGGPSGRPRAGV